MSAPENRYGDTPTSYSYPAKYRRAFEPLAAGEPTFAIVYEPRGRGTVRGRQAYVGWASLDGPPRQSPVVGVRGEPLWIVTYIGRMTEFPIPVPRDPMGIPIEGWLRGILPEHRDIRTSGESVRFITEEEARHIVELGYAAQLGDPLAGVEPLPEEPERGVAEERTRRLVTALERDARFRSTVMSTYGYSCAVSGFGIGTLAAGRATRLLDAAHIRPVSERGSDDVANGLALTPTLHRLFDEGLFTLVRRRDELQVVISPLLEPTMIESPDRSFRLPLVTGLGVRLPSADALQPGAAALRFHASKVFKGPESLL